MRFIFLLILAAIQFSANAQSIHFGKKSKIYLVRHGEKEPGDDPLLTKEGNKRAGDLARVLKNKKIGRIYVTQYKRTQNTGDSIRLQFGIDTVHYLADTSCIDLINKITANGDTDRPILIIGHSNTIPIVMRKLGLQGYPTANIPDNEFDIIYSC